MDKMIFPLITDAESKLPFYITSIGSLENQHYVHRPEGYTCWHWLHCTAGKGRLLIGGSEYIITENMGFLFNPGVPHEYYAVSEPWTSYWITFDGNAVQRLLNMFDIGLFTVFHTTDIQKLDMLYSDIYAAASSNHPVKGFECSCHLYKFLLEFKSCISTGDSKSKPQKYKQLHPLISFIEENYSQNISLDEMSGVLSITPQHLCRLFKQAFNMRPFEYLTKCRLQKAKEMLVSSGNPTLKEVAGMTGYNDTSYFCAVFKEYEGMTPVEFKKMHKEI